MGPEQISIRMRSCKQGLKSTQSSITNKMEFSILCETLKEWQTRIADIKEFQNEKGNYYYNVRRVIDHFRELSTFLRTNEPALRTWMMEYLTKHRKEIFVKWWTNHVSEWAQEQVSRFPRKELHPNTQAEWDKVFGKEKDTCFSLAHTVAKEAHTKHDIKFCDDTTIVAIHEDKEHDGNDYFCDLCDEQESLWTGELKRRLKNSAHPLLNPTRGYYFYFHWEDKIELGNWSPPKCFGTVYEERGKSHDCYDFEEYKKNIVSLFLQEKRGNTPIQATKHFLDHALFWQGWKISYEHDYKNEYNAFLLLWDCMDRIEPSIELGLPILQEIEEMF